MQKTYLLLTNTPQIFDVKQYCKKGEHDQKDKIKIWTRFWLDNNEEDKFKKKKIRKKKDHSTFYIENSSFVFNTQ